MQLKIAPRRLATTVSKTRRVSRFLNNDAVRVREWYEPVARGLEVRLLADGTKVGFEHQPLMVALVYRRRAPEHRKAGPQLPTVVVALLVGPLLSST